MKYEPVIGIEVHVELNTETKMFCRCSAEYFGEEPNTHTCPVCLGLPGALPKINEQAIDKCIQIGLALNCSINTVSYFERKNYFYPDLAKGFQTSQLVLPIAVNGFLDVEGDPSTSSGQASGKKKIRVNRAHQEEDTGKLTHQNGETLIDFNRSGVPLVEIVTEPDFNDPSQVRDYAKKLQTIFRTLKVSNADMEKGDMRLEANVSVRPVGHSALPPYRVELKNINSFRFMVAAVEYEIKRQIKALEKGEKLVQETRGWNEDKKETYLQRSKEEAHDYRYFPEPDLPELKVPAEKVQMIEGEVEQLLKEHPEQRREYLATTFGMSLASAGTIAYSPEKSAIFNNAIETGQIFQNQLGSFGNFIANIGTASVEPVLVPEVAKKFIEQFQTKTTHLISDEEELEKVCQAVIDENPDLVNTYKSGKVTIIQALIGQVMRKTQGKADAGKVKEILGKLLD